MSMEEQIAAAQSSVIALSRWVDKALAERRAEAVTLHRVMKLTEEAGEVSDALTGALGANPRKGVTNGMDKVLEELLDVALTALGAYEHIDGHRGRSIAELLSKIERVAQRAGVLELEPRPQG